MIRVPTLTVRRYVESLPLRLAYEKHARSYMEQFFNDPIEVASLADAYFWLKNIKLSPAYIITDRAGDNKTACREWYDAMCELQVRLGMMRPGDVLTINKQEITDAEFDRIRLCGF